MNIHTSTYTQSAISQSGYALSIIFFLIFSFLSATGLHLSMAAAKTISPIASYYSMGKASLPKVKKLVDLAVAVKCFLVGTSYLIVIGDNVPPVVHEFTPKETLETNDWLLDRRFWIFIFCAMFIFPVVALKRMNALKYTSMVSLLCFAYITIIVVLFAFKVMDPVTNQSNKMRAFPSDISFMKVIPIFIFSFTCHQNAFSITNELKNNTLSRLSIVIVNSITGCLIIYCAVGYCGYYTYGDEVEDDILVNYPEIVPVAVVRIALSIAIAWSYPLQLHPTRNCLSSFIWNAECAKISDLKFYLLTYAITLGSFVISMLVDSLGIMLSVVGSCVSPIISFILPGIFYYFLKNQSILQQDDYYQVKRTLAMILIVFGTLVIPFGLTVTFVFS